MKNKPLKNSRRVRKNLKTSTLSTSDVAPKSSRLFSLDFLKFAAVCTMIFTHVAALTFRYASFDSKIVFYLSLLGGLVSFTSFLFISGTGLYLSLISKDGEGVNEKRVNLLKKSSKILVFYYLLTVLSAYAFGSFPISSEREILGNLIDILLVLKLAQFTEFLITLIIFFILVAIFHKVLNYITRKWVLLVLLTPVSFLLGEVIYRVDLNSARLNNWKALWAGHSDINSFPILHYLPIFALGILWGKLIKAKGSKIKYYAAFSFGTIALTILSYVTFKLTGNNLFNLSVYDSRFPPSIGFLLAGLTFVSLILLFAELIATNKSKVAEKANLLVSFVSNNVFNFFILHTFLLLAFRITLDRYFESKRFTSFRETLLIFVITFLICSLFSFLIKFLRFEKLNRFNQIFKLSISIAFIAIAILISLKINYSDKIRPIDSIDFNKSIEIDQENTWWDDRYTYHYVINKDKVDSVENLYYIEINHKQLMNDKISFGEKDIHALAKIDDKFTDLQIHKENPNSENLIIYFRINSELLKPDLQLFLYSGNKVASSAPALQIEKENLASSAKLNIDLKNPKKHGLNFELSKNWYLKNTSEKPVLKIKLDLSKNTEAFETINYIIPEKKISKVINSNSKVFEDTLDMSDWKEGKYSLQLFAVDVNNNKLIIKKSIINEFYISQPLYVVWSLDWEGFGVNQSDLDDIVDISSKYKMPIVQFFNPRIYTENSSGSGVNKGLASYYTNWVLARKALGDEIGLHLHLYPDFIAEIEKHYSTEDNEVKIKPIYEPSALFGIGRDENSLAAYSKDDLVKILNWSLDAFKKQNLPFPTSFRSGAWMSSTQVLGALEEVGIKIDSSGRTAGDLNPSIPSSNDIPWSLSSTTYPYLPDRSNINSWVTGDRFNVWEFPNNGADSFWFSQEQLIERFTANYKKRNSVLGRVQVLTYLSHPHSFKQFDSAKIRATLDYISKFKYTDNKGPIVFSTFEEIYNNFPKENINGN